MANQVRGFRTPHGIVLRYLAQRHRAGRVLIVTRASPEPDRWRREMWTKFGFDFDILRGGKDFLDRRRRAPNTNVFAQQPRLIVSMALAARQVFVDELRKCPVPLDVVIVDEAHHAAERGSRTKRLSTLARVLAQKVGDGTLLLLTATPHDGKHPCDPSRRSERVGFDVIGGSSFVPWHKFRSIPLLPGSERGCPGRSALPTA